jgi:prolipoprotein diacylglyceryltransferase
MAFDVLAWATAFGIGAFMTRWRSRLLPQSGPRRGYYLPVLLIGAASGAYLLGTLNLWISGVPGIARSIEGAIFGGILAVETYKLATGLSGRTGARLAAPLAAGVAVGRIGCFLGGLDDFTYGTPTSLPWGIDFGDGVLRHPVQLYESGAMLFFLGWYLYALQRRSAYVALNGFTLAVGYYGAQRFVWEFLKPYGSVVGPFSLFHLTSLALCVYAAVLLRRAKAHFGKAPGMA